MDSQACLLLHYIGQPPINVHSDLYLGELDLMLANFHLEKSNPDEAKVGRTARHLFAQ